MERQTRKNPFHNTELGDYSVWIDFPRFLHLLDVGATSAGAPGFFTLFGLPFILIELGLTVGPSIWQLMRYRNTEYMITDQRVITQTGAIGLDTRFFEFDKIQEVYVQVGFISKSSELEPCMLQPLASLASFM
jgi:hypothetical protein